MASPELASDYHGTMPSRGPDAFILFNEREDAVAPIVEELGKRGVSTFFWRRDVQGGETWDAVEGEKMRAARSVLVFLGDKGWGPHHLPLARQALGLGKPLIPILIGTPRDDALLEVEGLFTARRYIDLREVSQKGLALLVQSVESVPDPTQFESVIGTIRDGNESQRLRVLLEIQSSRTINRRARSGRIRAEIQERFGPQTEKHFASAIRDPKKIASIRSWLFSCLIAANAEDLDNQALFLDHLSTEKEPDRNVRFWLLGQLLVAGASCLRKAAERATNDSAQEVAFLGRAIISPGDPELLGVFRSQLRSGKFEHTWEVLRVLRTLPLPELAGDVCQLLGKRLGETSISYDAIYALSNPQMAQAAVPFLKESPGIDAAVRIVLEESIASDDNARESFGRFLRSFPMPDLDRALDVASEEHGMRAVAESLRAIARESRELSKQPGVRIARILADTVDTSADHIGISEDVSTLAAVMLAKEVRPPLAIGLFGDWGTGKSFFMESLRVRTEELSRHALQTDPPKFCTRVVSIKFNAWHYADTNLWASMVSYILDQLATHVTPGPSAEDQKRAMVAQLGSAKSVVEEAEREKRRTQEQITLRAAELQRAQATREEKEISLRDLRASDFRALIDKHPALKKEIEDALGQMGIPKLLDSATDLAEIVAEAGTLRGRVVAVGMSIITSRDRLTMVLLLLVVILGIPLAAHFIGKLTGEQFFVRAGTVAGQIASVLWGARRILSTALGRVNDGLSKVERAKREVDDLLAHKRSEPSPKEGELQREIATLKAKEQEAELRLSAATNRVVELEERIRGAREGGSLAKFLQERTSSEDYRKHLGLISTVRLDFEALASRLIVSANEDGSTGVERIVLYIDDLDRCPEDKVMEVLEAVHLLLAYPIFVVVVGVDPRWLLHSLQGRFRAFRASGETGTADQWKTTPQNYLEKIFQIPFNLRPMSREGYSSLISALFPASEEAGIPKEERVSGWSATLNPSTDSSAITPRRHPPIGTESVASASTSGQPTVTAPNSDMSGEAAPAAQMAFEINSGSLEVTAWERDFAVRLFPLIPTPRAAKRFSNVYRLLKAPIQKDRLPAFEGTTELPGEFQVPLFLLAVLIGAPSEASVLFVRMLQLASEHRDPLNAIPPDDDAGGWTGVIARVFNSIAAGGEFPRVPQLFEYWIPRVSRFSFDVGRAVEALKSPFREDTSQPGE